MKYIHRTWHYLFAEPLIWLFYCFFQQSRFTDLWKIEGTSGLSASAFRVTLRILRMALSIFILSYPFGLVGRFIFITYSQVPETSIISLLLTSATYNLVGLMVGVVFTLVSSFIVIFETTNNVTVSYLLGITLSFTLSVKLEVSQYITRTYKEAFLVSAVIFGVFLILGIFAGKETRLFAFLMGISFGILVGILIIFTGVLMGAILAGIIFGIFLGTFSGDAEIIDFSTAIIYCVAISIPQGLVIGIITGLTSNIGSGIALGLIDTSLFSIGYLLCWFRLLFYPFNEVSMLRTFFRSRKQPDQVFINLHHSSLYWDETVHLPLTGLKDTLLIAYGQNVEDTLKEIVFIANERSLQIRAARAASLEIALHELEMQDTMRAIAQTSERLAVIFPEGTNLIDSRWATTLARLKDICEDADRYVSPLSRRARREALKNILANLTSLKKTSTTTVFVNSKLDELLGKVVNKWETIAQQELSRLEMVLLTTGQIDNPYTAGPPLRLHNSPFVGRRDLAQQLEKALNKENRPTFFLHGERRMGKSSTLNQLPNFLGTSYLPIFYDLQSPAISSSTATLFGAISKGIYEVMASKGMKVRRLEYDRLPLTGRRNEASIYTVFDEWLTELERVLEEEDRTILLALDEFEKLEEAALDGYLNIRLLLDWFRSIVQNHPRFALLFSGVRTLGEIGSETDINWAGYFVNVETLRVSFLQRSEALQLITRPIPDYPSEEIFGDGVVEEVIRVTGCHPFLVQAVCSRLVDNLNGDNRDRAEIQDVAIAIDHVLESWWDTYFLDLWQRTNREQRVCLFAVNGSDETRLQNIVQQSGLDEKTARSTLEILRKRDLVLRENGSYLIASPIFSEWVKRNS